MQGAAAADVVCSQATSPMVFPSTRVGTKAVQAVQVTSQPSAGINNAKRSHTFTFCLEHVTQGPYKVQGIVCLTAHSDAHCTWFILCVCVCICLILLMVVYLIQGCWMTVGLRVGDYANV